MIAGGSLRAGPLGAWAGAALAVLLLGAAGTLEAGALEPPDPPLAAAAASGALAQDRLVGALIGLSALGPAAALGAAAWAVALGGLALVRRRRHARRWREVERMERAMFASRRRRQRQRPPAAGVD